MPVNIHEAKTQFSKLVSRVMCGEEILIAKAGRPVARLIAYEETSPDRRTPGFDRGRVVIKPDFDAPITEFEG